nr:reverse transcriptase domain-containing protein [Tanacetum cinerariifolium]
NPNNMTPEVVQTMIDQALLRNFGGGDRSHKVKKLEIELLNLKVRDNDIPAYTNRFQELALICTKFVSNETEKVNKYISGLPYNIYGNVKSSKPKTLDETIELANDLMDQKLRTYAERKSDSKRKVDDISRNNQQPFMKQNVAKAYNLGFAEKKTYEGNVPKCTKCQRHFKRDCPKLNNKNGGNGNAQGWVYDVGNAERNGNAARNLDSNVVTDCPKLNNKNGGNGNAQGWVYDVGNAERNGNAARNPDSNVVTVQEYRTKGCHVFLAQISATKEDDKSEGKQVKDVPIIQDFPEVFLENLPGLPPARSIEFQIDLIPGAAPVARAPYRLAPSEM